MNISRIYFSSIKLYKRCSNAFIRNVLPNTKVIGRNNTVKALLPSVGFASSIFILKNVNASDEEIDSITTSDSNTSDDNDQKMIELYEEILDNIIPPDKSEKADVIDTSSLIKRVVGDTAKRILLDTDKNVILKVYSPTCDVCKNFDYIWNTIAEEIHLNVNDIDFTEMNGQDNYVRGLIDYSNQGKYPHIVCFPKGEKKVKDFETAHEKITRLAEYYNNQLPKEIQSRFDFDVTNADSKSDVKPEFTFKDVEVIGVPYSMRWEKGQSLISSLIDFIFDNSLVSTTYNREDIKRRVFERLPEIEENILRASNYSFMAPYDKAITNDPCGKFIKTAMEYFFLSTGGLPTASLGSLTMSKYRSCLYDNEPRVKEFYDNIKTHMQFVDSCFNEKDLWNEQDEAFLKSLAEKKPELYAKLVDQANTVY